VVVTERTVRNLTWFAAAALVVSAAWYGLSLADVTTPPRPPDDPSLPFDVRVETYLTWFRGTLPQEYVYGAIAILGFAGTAVVFQVLRDRLARSPLATLASVVGIVGATLWIVGNVLQLGGHRAVEVLAQGRTDLRTANAILLTVDTIDDRFELFAFLGLGVALLAFARAGGTFGTGWRAVSSVVGALLLATAAAYAGEWDDPTDVLLLLGAVGVPVWLVLTGRRLDQPTSAAGA
jgi:hypothetical protein